jgi:hypothetical protein
MHMVELALQAGVLFPPQKCPKNDLEHVYVFRFVF